MPSLSALPARPCVWRRKPRARAPPSRRHAKKTKSLFQRSLVCKTTTRRETEPRKQATKGELMRDVSARAFAFARRDDDDDGVNYYSVTSTGVPLRARVPLRGHALQVLPPEQPAQRHEQLPVVLGLRLRLVDQVRSTARGLKISVVVYPARVTEGVARWTVGEGTERVPRTRMRQVHLDLGMCMCLARGWMRQVHLRGGRRRAQLRAARDDGRDGSDDILACRLRLRERHGHDARVGRRESVVGAIDHHRAMQLISRRARPGGEVGYLR